MKLSYHAQPSRAKSKLTAGNQLIHSCFLRSSRVIVTLDLHECEMEDPDLAEAAEEDGEEEGSEQLRVTPRFSIEIRKNGQTLYFNNCSVEDGAVNFADFGIETADSKDKVYYTNAYNLNEDFYTAIADDFLASRGLDEEFVNFLITYVDKKVCM